MGHVRSAGALILGSIISSFTVSANAVELPLRRILLTTGGVGYFEHEAAVSGDATLSLDVRLDQVSDVLKSIVVFDARGQLGRATLAGREPLAEMFRDLPFTLTDLESPASLLRALRGSTIRMTVNASVMEGRIISVTDELTSLGDERGTVLRHRITLMGSTGLRQAIIEDATAIEIVDPTLRDSDRNCRSNPARSGGTSARCDCRAQRTRTTHGVHSRGRGRGALGNGGVRRCGASVESNVSVGPSNQWGQSPYGGICAARKYERTGLDRC
jgi:hypothetical protein